MECSVSEERECDEAATTVTNCNATSSQPVPETVVVQLDTYSFHRQWSGELDESRSESGVCVLYCSF
jgi:hypothetical protein